VSPSRVCGTSGLRPTFGRVSRYGCMTLCWSMDKIGPLARSLEDCAVIFGAIHGRDGLDNCAVDRPFSWPCTQDVRSLKVGYFEGRTGKPELDVLKNIGVKLVPIKLPSKYPVSALTIILHAEAAAVFDEVPRKDLRESLESWNTSFRAGQFVPAVEYLRANRIRSLVMQEMEEVMSQVDLYVGGDDLVLTNFTGHPTLVMPNGFRKTPQGDLPNSITFTGRLYGESELLAVGHAYQQATGHHLRHPDMSKLKEKKD
jgi:Asp-tRNA(Asn)/Glu-tRNA(Gln) amidotransferase A subunit family amidase